MKQYIANLTKRCIVLLFRCVTTSPITSFMNLVLKIFAVSIPLYTTLNFGIHGEIRCLQQPVTFRGKLTILLFFFINVILTALVSIHKIT